MAGPENRVGERTPTAMRIKLRYPDIDTFIQKYAVNISRGGIFIATKTPKPIGTLLRFEFVLAQTEPGMSIIRGEGQVQWTREFDAAQPTKAHGMGVKFTRLDAESQQVVDRALAWRSAHSAGEGHEVVAETRTPAAVPTGSVNGEAAHTAPPAETKSRVDTDAPAAPPLSRLKSTSTSATLPAPAPVKPTASDQLFDAPTPVRTLRSDGTLAAANGEDIPAPRPDNSAADAQLDGLAASWGLSAERIASTLARPRAPMASPEAALAELEQLRAKPIAAPLATAEALAELRRLLE